MPVRRAPRLVGAKIVYKPNTNNKVDTNYNTPYSNYKAYTNYTPI